MNKPGMFICASSNKLLPEYLYIEIGVCIRRVHHCGRPVAVVVASATVPPPDHQSASIVAETAAASVKTETCPETQETLCKLPRNSRLPLYNWTDDNLDAAQTRTAIVDQVFETIRVHFKIWSTLMCDPPRALVMLRLYNIIRSGDRLATMRQVAEAEADMAMVVRSETFDSEDSGGAIGGFGEGYDVQAVPVNRAASVDDFELEPERVEYGQRETPRRLRYYLQHTAAAQLATGESSQTLQKLLELVECNADPGALVSDWKSEILVALIQIRMGISNGDLDVLFGGKKRADANRLAIWRLLCDTLLDINVSCVVLIGTVVYD